MFDLGNMSLPLFCFSLQVFANYLLPVSWTNFYKTIFEDILRVVHTGKVIVWVQEVLAGLQNAVLIQSIDEKGGVGKSAFSTWRSYHFDKFLSAFLHKKGDLDMQAGGKMQAERRLPESAIRRLAACNKIISLHFA